MAWKPLEIPPKEEKAYIESLRLAKHTKFLVDENVAEYIAEDLREIWNANIEFAADVGLKGKDDSAVFAYAWRKKRVLLTHDDDFLDDTRFPANRNPGVVILPGGSGQEHRLERALYIVVDLIGRDPNRWRGAKLVIGANGEVDCKRLDRSKGRIKRTRMKQGNGSELLIWEDE